MSKNHYENFPVASALLPARLRIPVTVIYRFARAADDFSDEGDRSDHERLALLGGFGDALRSIERDAPASSEQGSRLRDANVRESGAAPSSAGVASVSGVTSPKGAPVPPSDGAPQHPVAQALAAVIPAFKLPQARLQEIIDGMEMDLTQRRYADFAALKLYCHRAAGVVGLLSAEIFGYNDPGTLKYAENLGMAFQLTNIIRDVGEDARRDRIYLPLDELARYNVTVADIMHARKSDGFRQLMEFQIKRALGYYHDAFALLPATDRKSQRPGLVMAAIYQTLLAEILADGVQVLTHRISLTPIRKLWIAWKTWIKG
jgi:phytoene synthase